MTRVARPESPKHFPPLRRKLVFALGLILASIFFYTRSDSETRPNASAEIGTKYGSSSSELVTGTVDGVAYYHCFGSGDTSSSAKTQHLVLLHGARFTKEDWKTSGILTKFCRNKNLSVSAMDLPVSAGHQELTELLTAMQDEGLVSLPVALVTPSASGKTVTDWMKAGENRIDELPKYVFRWIPVASGSVATTTDEQVRNLQNLESFSVFAIFGNKDSNGEKTSNILGTLGGAKVLEIQGGHPCYLDSPDDFVAAILENLGVSKLSAGND